MRTQLIQILLLSLFGAAHVQAAAEPPARAPAVSHTVTSTADLHRRFADSFNGGNVKDLLALFEPTAGFVAQPGQIAIGQESIRTVLNSFLALKGTLKLVTVHAVEVGDLALLRGHYHLNGTDGAGKPVELQGKTVEVARRQPDGTWLFVIDFPHGAD